MDDGAKKNSTAYRYPQSYFFAHCQAMNQSHFRSYLLHFRSIKYCSSFFVLVVQLVEPCFSKHKGNLQLSQPKTFFFFNSSA